MENNDKDKIKQELLSLVYSGELKRDMKNELRCKLIRFYLQENSSSRDLEVKKDIMQDEFQLVQGFLTFHSLNYTMDILALETKDFKFINSKIKLLLDNEENQMRKIIDHYMKTTKLILLNQSQQTDQIIDEESYADLKLQYKKKFEEFKNNLNEKFNLELEKKLNEYIDLEKQRMRIEITEQQEDRFKINFEKKEELLRTKQNHVAKREWDHLLEVEKTRNDERLQNYLERQSLQHEIEAIRNSKKELELEKKELEVDKTNQIKYLNQRESELRQREEELKMKQQSFENLLNGKLEQLKRNNELSIAKERTNLEVMRVSLDEEKRIFINDKINFQKFKSKFEEKLKNVSELELISIDELKLNLKNSEENLAAMRVKVEELNKKIVEKENKIYELENQNLHYMSVNENFDSLQQAYRKLQREKSEKESSMTGEIRKLSEENSEMKILVDRLKDDLKMTQEKSLKTTMRLMEERRKIDRTHNLDNNTSFKQCRDDFMNVRNNLGDTRIEEEIDLIQESFKNWEMNIRKKFNKLNSIEISSNLSFSDYSETVPSNFGYEEQEIKSDIEKRKKNINEMKENDRLRGHSDTSEEDIENDDSD